MKLKIKLLLTLLSSLLITSCASIPLETTYVPARIDGWKVGYAKDIPGQGNIVERIPAQESINNWSKMITIQFIEGSGESPKFFMSKLQKQMENRCTNVKWDVLEDNTYTVLYEWVISQCGEHPDQHEISKLLKGNDGLHRAAYIEKTQSIDPKTREKWVQWLSESYLTKGRERVVVQ